ncbi:MAG: hypothetical protein IV090_25735 [Candidatus Sericytochromatia bacterium]|nr:hypothetical protein [Candidatus Sericytochromatia bacterium]
MKTKHLLLTSLCTLGLLLQSLPLQAETQTFALSEKVVQGPYQSSEEVRILTKLRVARRLNEQVGQYLAQLPQLKAAFLPHQFGPLAIALFPAEVFELDQGSEIKAKLLLDTSLIPVDLKAFQNDNLYMLESIAHHQARNHQLENDLALYLQDLAKANGAEHAEMLRQTRGQPLLKQYQSNRLFVEAANLFGRSRWQDAIHKLDQAIQGDPGYMGHYFLRAIAYFQLKNYDRTLADLNLGLKIEPNNEGLYFFRGLTYLVQGALLPQALADLNKTIELNPKNAQAYYVRGAAYSSQNRCDKAKADYNQACNLGLSEACPLDCTPPDQEELF